MPRSDAWAGGMGDGVITVRVRRERDGASWTVLPGGGRKLMTYRADVLRFDESALVPQVAYPGDCLWCFMCEIHCPGQAVVVNPMPRPVSPAYAHALA